MTYLVAPSSYVPINTIVPSWMDFRNPINGATSEKRENTKLLNNSQPFHI